jgi:hypothetical protein
MEIYLNQILTYLKVVLESTFNLILILFVPLLVLMFLMNLSASVTAKLSVRFLGKNLFLYGFAWLGCSVHELSHAFFALIFGHKIREITLFKPSGNGESMGHVSHSYNKKSIYQKTGNFFIGTGPLLAGGIVLFLMTYLLFGLDITEHRYFVLTPKVFTDSAMLKQFFAAVWNGLRTFFFILVPDSGLVWWKPALFIYVLYSSGSSMTLSKPDVEGAFSGLMWLLVLVLIINLFTRWTGVFESGFPVKAVKYISAFYFLLVLSFLANLLFITVLFILNLFKRLFVKG